MAITTKFRDQRLDIAKGIAIILVVIGHTIQNRFSDFDEHLGFRLIYSFHMPLFIFLSGAVASMWFKPEEINIPFKELLSVVRLRIQKSAIRLLLPFISWALISHFVYQTTDTALPQIVITAFRRPDSALWFLLCIFYCVVMMSLFQLLLGLLGLIGRRSRLIAPILLDGKYQLIIVIGAWFILKNYVPPGAGLGTLKAYFIFYVLGILFYKYLVKVLPSRYYLISYIVFIPLALLWSRVAPNYLLMSLTSGFPSLILGFCYAFVVAISGTLLIWDLVSRLDRANFIALNAALAYCGKLSLGIYALHYFFLELNPPVVMPLALSIAISITLLQFRLTKLFLLGER